MVRIDPLHCIQCRIRHYTENVHCDDEEKLECYLQKARQLISEYSHQGKDALNRVLQDNYESFFGKRSYGELKRHFNDLMLNSYASFENMVQTSKDPLLSALQLTLAGNYIDYGVFDHIDEATLNYFLETSQKTEINPQTYGQLKETLAKAQTLLYLTDNCGEIVLDKLFISQIQKAYPQLEITVMVKGGEAVNDATLEDAKQVHFEEICHVTDNGAALTGMHKDAIPSQKWQLLETADVILSKGMANAESLFEYDYPVFFLLMCKCEYFAALLDTKLMTGVLYHR